MGEAPAFFADDLQCNFTEELQGCETTVNVGCNQTYLIGTFKRESSHTIGVKIFDRSMSKWVVPTVLGAKPKASMYHSAVSLDEDRILVIRGNAAINDCFWFLEVNTAFIREQRTRLGNEVVAWSRGVVGEALKPVVISGPSGVGKGTLISKLMKDFPSVFGFSVSHTTRAPRINEQNGIHYHFTGRDVMKNDIKDGKFLEFAAVHGNLYGTSVEAVEAVTDQGKRCILDIDVQGARSVRASSLEAIFIFVCPPSFEELEKRLCARGTETEEQIEKRLRNAKAELEQGKCPGLFDNILVNDNLETCYENLKKVLGLSDSINTSKISELIHIPKEHTGSMIDQKILINCNTEQEKSSATNMFVLDLSSISGGAPGGAPYRTRGLNIYTAKQSADGTITKMLC